MATHISGTPETITASYTTRRDSARLYQRGLYPKLS